MLFLFLGLLDLVFAILMLLMHYDVLSHWRIAVFGAIFWVGKGVLFRGSFLSTLDVLAGIYFIFVMFGLKTALVFLFLGIMVYKFIVSLVLRG